MTGQKGPVNVLILAREVSSWWASRISLNLYPRYESLQPRAWELPTSLEEAAVS